MAGRRLSVARKATSDDAVTGRAEGTAPAEETPGEGDKKNAWEAAECVKLAVFGMTCSGCADAVRRAVMRCRGVEKAVVDLSRGEIEVSGTGFNVAEIVAAVKGAGYEARPSACLP
jgi:copper chaperone CopZ